MNELEDKKQKWYSHVSICNDCARAIHGRFAQESLQNMYSKCCPLGKQLYRDFINYNEPIEYIKE